jgi:hypothetical protein
LVAGNIRPCRPFSTLETVLVETLAALATSWIVTATLLPFR